MFYSFLIDINSTVVINWHDWECQFAGGNLRSVKLLKDIYLH